jgi:histone H3/H4
MARSKSSSTQTARRAGKSPAKKGAVATNKKGTGKSPALSIKSKGAKAPAKKTGQEIVAAKERIHKFRKGTAQRKRVLRALRRQNERVLASAPGRRFVVEVASTSRYLDGHRDIRFKKTVPPMLMDYTERSLTELFAHANQVAKHAKHERVTPEDVKLAARMMPDLVKDVILKALADQDAKAQARS